MLSHRFKRVSAPSTSNAVGHAWHNSLDPVTRAMVDPEYAREIAQQSKICGVCRDLDLSHPMSTLTTATINGRQADRREATIDINGASWSTRNIKDCGYCAMISDAIQKFCPDFFLGGWQLPRLESITLATDEPILLTMEEKNGDGTGGTERFGIEIYRDANAKVPSTLDYIGVISSATGVNSSRKQVSWRHNDSIKFITESMAECAVDHMRCRKKITSDRKLPTRILDLEALTCHSPGSGNDDASRSDIRLVITSDLPTSELESLSYAALSHSWGIGGIPFTLEKNNVEEFKDRIPFSRVPATHKDAIVLARRLGFRYLWIDSLCIIQRFEKDTQTETAKMGDIYTNAELTIAAVSSPSSKISFLALKDDKYTRSVPVRFYGARLPYHTRDILGSSGLRRTYLNSVLRKTTGATPAITFHARRTLRLAMNHAADNSASFNAPQSIADAVQGPLSLRAWTLQERALASRIVHFTAEGVKFECPTHLKSEDGKISSGTPGYCARWRELDSQLCKVAASGTADPRRHPAADVLRTAHPAFYKVQPTVLKTVDVEQLATLRNDIQIFWRTMLRDYTSRAISYRTDYLPALSGIAGRIQSMLNHIDNMKNHTISTDIALVRASRAIEPTPPEYVAGLWRDRLVEDLCWITQDAKWHKTPPIRTDETDLPSWSWASINHPTVYPLINEKGTFIPHCEVVSCSTNLTKSQWNNFGHVTSGELILRGPVRKGKLTYAGQVNGGSGTVDFGMGAFADLEEDARLISFEADVPFMSIAEEREAMKLGQHPELIQNGDATSRRRGSAARKEKSWRRITEGEQGKWDQAEVYCIKIGSWRPARSDLDDFMSGMDLDFVMVLGRSARVPDAFQKLGFLQKDYGGSYFDNVGDAIRKMDRHDRLMEECARVTGTPVQPKTKEEIEKREKLRNEWFYPEARVIEMRIV